MPAKGTLRASMPRVIEVHSLFSGVGYVSSLRSKASRLSKLSKTEYCSSVSSLRLPPRLRNSCVTVHFVPVKHVD
jgi:hypothetical protein